MNPAPEISIVVPVYNEEDNLSALVTEIDRALTTTGRPFELVLVNDGSTDGSLHKSRDLQRDYPFIRILDFVKNAGQSAAMHAGLNQARGQMIVTLDADLQNDPADIPAMLELLKTHDLVCGYRKNRRDTWSKRIASRIANAVRSRFVGDGVRDTGCTLKAYRRETVRCLPLFRGMHRFIPALIKSAGHRITEIPVNHRPRRHGVSKYTVAGRAFKATMDMFGVAWLRSRQCYYDIKPEN